MIHLRKHPLAGYVGLVCLGILSGVAFIKFSGHDEKSHLILCSEYFLYQYAYEAIEYKELLFYVLVNRIPLFLFFLVGVFSKYRRRIMGCVFYIFSLGLTYLIGVTMLRYGVRAFALVIGLMTPQILFYVQAIYLLVKPIIRTPWKSLGWGSAFFILGLLSEVYLNPRWLRFLLGLF